MYDVRMNVPTVIYAVGSVTDETKASVEAVAGPVAWLEYVPSGNVAVPILATMFRDVGVDSATIDPNALEV